MKLAESNPPTSAPTRSAHRVAVRARLQRNETRAVLNLLTDAQIDQLVRRGMLAPVPDGYPGVTMSDGMPHGKAPLDSVQAATYRLLGVSDTIAEGGEKDDNLRVESDPLGCLIGGVLDSVRQMNNLAAGVERDLKKILHSPERAEIRRSEPGGPCSCCLEGVTGSEWDRLRRGLCNRCYHGWRVWSRDELAAGRDPSRVDVSGEQVFVAWMRTRTREAEQDQVLCEGRATPPPPARLMRPPQVSEIGKQPASVVTGGFVRGVGESAPGVVRASEQVNGQVSGGA